MPKARTSDLGAALIETKGRAVKPGTPPAENKPMNFKVPPSFIREFKQYALDHDLRLNEVLLKAFEKLKGDKDGR